MEEKLNEIILKIIDENDINIEFKQIDKSLHLVDDLGFDSFNLAQLTVEIEEEFGVDIYENGIVKTVEDIIIALS